MTDREIDRVGVIGTRMKHAGHWWYCIGADSGHVVKVTGECVRQPRGYMLIRDGASALVPASAIEAVERPIAARER